jgi:hypothetical protein
MRFARNRTLRAAPGIKGALAIRASECTSTLFVAELPIETASGGYTTVRNCSLLDEMFNQCREITACA